MQEEIEQKSFNIMISTTKLSARTVLRAVKAAFRLYQSKTSQGKQSVRTLLRQNRGVSSVEISKTGIRGLERYVKEAEIKQALFNKGYPIYDHQFTAGLGPAGTDKLETLKYPTNEAQRQNWLTDMSGGVDMAVDNPRCFAMSVRSIGGEDYFIALVVGEKVPH